MKVDRDVQSLYDLDVSDLGMDLKSYESPRKQGEALYQEMRHKLFLVKVRDIAWSHYCNTLNGKGDESPSQMVSVMSKIINESGLHEVITNTVIKLYEGNVGSSQRSKYDTNPMVARKSTDERIDCVKQVRIEWEQGINEELMAISQEMSRPFMQTRGPEIFAKYLGGEIASLNGAPQRESVRFLFDSEDLLETGIGIRSFNTNPDHVNRAMGMLKLSVATPSLHDLQRRYADLGAHLSQLGLDEARLGACGGTKFISSRHEEAEALAAFGTAIQARKYMRRGVPPSMRPKIWRAALALPADMTQDEEKMFATLRGYCDHLDLLTDSLYMHDVENVVDDPRFFVFEEELKECVMCFSRDSWVRNNAAYVVHSPATGLQYSNSSSGSSGGLNHSSSSSSNGDKRALGGVGNSENGNNKKMPSSIPTSNVQPFLGFAIYSAPLCYIFNYMKLPSLYSVMRAMWARIWCKLNVISADNGTLVHVCATFEALLMQMHPSLFLHLMRIGVQPLLIAMPWLQFGFVGLLEVDQILHLWDRLIGYDDPILLAVTAVAVFLSRAEMVMATEVPSEAVTILMEGSRIRVVPLLQMLLFSDASDK